jgi:putative intracellular protease/amidase
LPGRARNRDPPRLVPFLDLNSFAPGLLRATAGYAPAHHDRSRTAAPIKRGLAVLRDIADRLATSADPLGACWSVSSLNLKRKVLIMKILMVLTSHDQLGDTGRKTGFWLEELAAPYFVFKDAGAKIVLASPKGGQPPLDPKSNEPSFQTDLTHRFEADAAAKAQLASTVRLEIVRQDDYDTVFYPGGHGPMWDLAEDQHSIRLLESFVAAGKTLAMVCHAPGSLRHVKAPNGMPFVEGKTVTGFTNGEEEEVGLTKVVPFLVEDELLRLGATFSKVKNWGVYKIADGQLITGQNPASSGPTAKHVLETLYNTK